MNRELTRRQKRFLVLGRLGEPDANVVSDRSIARELGVSQPFVSAMRRRVGATAPRGTRPARTGIEERQPTGTRDVLGAEVPSLSGEDKAITDFYGYRGSWVARSVYDQGVGRALMGDDPFK
jgi:hypothetical protein